ncbi:hypothetical protein Tco_0740282, partial [Tanacetum coccineum]
MSTSSSHQQSLADAGSETRPPMHERGSYIPWASRFRRSGYQQKDRKPSQNDKTEHGMEKTVQNQGQNPNGGLGLLGKH